MAKLYTEERSETVAVNKFKEVLRRSDMWFNSQPFPSSESGDDAFIKCRDPTSAQEHCPERWNAMQKWITNTIDVSYALYKNPLSVARNLPIYLASPVLPGEHIYQLFTKIVSLAFFSVHLFQPCKE